ncbi:hypothetical protein [Butyrivibrio sp. XBB1001]|uniref:hypothetical protein n=1 Tax=Butyrivibrio sp. XBB1001 TaxID=1280682 RepID=UPI0003F78430|nr:hypothetical protein [Butyrivibrio sp. XBB1001]
MDKIKKILVFMFTLILLGVALGSITPLFERKASYEKYADFFDEREDIDVWFLGSSHMLNAVFPMQLWKDYGIVSYNFGGHSSQIATSYWVMENALNYKTPKVVVIDGYLLSSEWKASDIFSYLHLSFDAFPISKTKIMAVNDLLNDEGLEKSIQDGTARQSDEKRTKIGLLWNFSVYHSRWNELTKNDFNPAVNLEKGAESRVGICKANKTDKISTYSWNNETTAEVYLRRIIEECQARNIRVVLTYLPYVADETGWEEAERLSAIAKEYDLQYLDFLDLDIVDYETDFYNFGHLNPSGARKVTDYCGKILSEGYGLEDRRSQESYVGWNKDYYEYEEYCDNLFRKSETLDEYLMLTSSSKVAAEIKTSNDMVLNNTYFKKLCDNTKAAGNELSIKTGNYSNLVDITISRNGKVIDRVSFDVELVDGSFSTVECTRQEEE